MIKKLIPTLLVAIAVSVAGMTQASAQDVKIATINTKKVIEGYWKTDVLNEEMKKDEEALQKENNEKLEDIKKRTDEIKKLREQLSDANLPKNTRAQLEQRYKISFNRLKNLEMTRREYIQGKAKALQIAKNNQQQEMLKDVQEIIAKIATEKGYDFVFDKGERIGVVLYAKKSFDITDDILAKLNEGQKKK